MANDENHNRPHEDHCSFCGQPRSEVGVLFTGSNGAQICDQCIERGYDMLAESERIQEQSAPQIGKRFSCLSLPSSWVFNGPYPETAGPWPPRRGPPRRGHGRGRPP